MSKGLNLTKTTLQATEAVSKNEIIKSLKEDVKNLGLSADEIQKTADVAFESAEKVFDNFSSLATIGEVAVGMIELYLIERETLDNLILDLELSGQGDSDLVKGLKMIQIDMELDGVSYFIRTWGSEVVIKEIAKNVTKWVYEVFGVSGSVASVVGIVTKILSNYIYQGPKADDITEAILQTTFITNIDIVLSQYRAKFLTHPATETDIEAYERLYSAFLAANKAACEACDDMLTPAQRWHFECGADAEEIGSTYIYDYYLKKCKAAVQADISNKVLDAGSGQSQITEEVHKQSTAERLAGIKELCPPNTGLIWDKEQLYTKGSLAFASYIFGLLYDRTLYPRVNSAAPYELIDNGNVSLQARLVENDVTVSALSDIFTKAQIGDVIVANGSHGLYAGIVTGMGSGGPNVYDCDSTLNGNTQDFLVQEYTLNFNKMVEEFGVPGGGFSLYRIQYRVNSGQSESMYYETYDDSVNYIVEDGVLTGYKGSRTTLHIPDDKGITSIKAGCFKNNKNIINVYVPDTVTSIGEGAFEGCTNLQFAKLSQNLDELSNRMFYGCTSLSVTRFSGRRIGNYAFYNCNVHILNCGDTVEEIGDHAFYNNKNLTDVYFSDVLTSIGAYAFQNCTSLESVDIPNSVTSIGRAAFSECTNLSKANLPLSLVKLEYQAFYDCTSLTHINIPKSLNDVGHYSSSGIRHYGTVFGGSGLKTVEFEEGITSIPSYLFLGASNLESVEIPYTVTSIGRAAFSGCTSLSKANLPLALVKMEYQAFCNCSSLTHINIPKTLNDVGHYTSDNGIRSYGTVFGGSGLKTVEFEEGITSIPSYLFLSASNLESVEIPYTVTSIGRSAFSGCTSLAKANLPLALVKMEYQAFYNCSSLTHINIPKTLNDVGHYTSDNGIRSYGTVFGGSGIKTVEFEEGITSIPSRLFLNAANLESVEIPYTVTSIGYAAFYGCTNLSKANLPLSLVKMEYQAFGNCTSLTHINIPKSLNDVGYDNTGYTKSWGAVFGDSGIKTVEFEEGITSIPDRLFLKAANLEAVEIPDTVTKIGISAFSGCTSLETAKLSSNLATVGNYAFEGCSSLKEIDIPETVTSMGVRIFDECTSLYKAHIPTIWKNIPQGIFRNCASLTEINFPDGLTTIEGEAFYGCESLPALDLPDSVQAIGNSAFYGCDALKEVIISENVTSLGDDVFSDCQGLTKAAINANCKIGDNTFRNCGALKTAELNNKGNVAGYTFYNCDALETVIINNTGSVGGYMFYDCDGLVSITFGDGVTSLGSNAFYDCDALTSLTLNDSITSIGASFCYGCELLSEINFGKYIETIPDSAFRQCPSLETVKLPHFLKTIAANAFAEDTKLFDVYVPARISKIENTSFSYPLMITMHGRTGSYAEEYANIWNMTFDPIDEPITDIAFEESEVYISRGKTLRPVLNFSPGFDTDIITFVSGDENIAMVSDTGVISVKNYGTTTVAALTEDGLRTDIKVLIINPATSITLSKTTLELEANTSESLTMTSRPNGNNDSFVWSSGDEKIAVVDQQGNVTAIAPGETDITVKSIHGGASAVCHVVVSASGVTVVPVTGVKLTPNKCEIMVGGSKTLQAEIVPADATNKALQWSSDNTDVAEVIDGVVTAKAEGKANITVRTAVGGYEAKCAVTVVPKAEITELTVTPMGQYALVTVKAVNIPKNAVVYLAAFGDGQLRGAQTVAMTDGSGQVIVPLDGVEFVKAIMWESLDSMRPICRAKQSAI